MTYIPPRRSDSTIQQTRVQQPWPADRPFRILAIDGGGIRGVFPAAYLTEIERRFLGGRSIATCFDMIAGTSTGGIIALALGQGMSAAAALKIYEERGEKIFPSASGIGKFRRAIKWLSKPKHDQGVLRGQLLQVFGEGLLDDAKTRLVIPSFEGRFGEPFLYKTPHHPDYQKDRHKRFAHVALHTSAAPSYYPGVNDDGYVMIDGGLWANNPVMNAVVDTLACFDVPRDNVRVLSIGTGESTFTVDEKSRVGGALHWAVMRAFTAASRAQSLNALGQAYLLLGKQNIVRVDPPETAKLIALDDVKRSLLELPPLARSMAEASGHHVASMFLADAADPFVKCPLS
jgi:patatin-like phospholipase/acyl hydrolase